MKIRQLFLLVIFLLSYAPIFAQVDTAWVRRYNGPGNSNEGAYDLAVDINGNVYVTGYTFNQFDLDYATVKYSPDGDTLWVRHYAGLASGNDIPYALALDDSGNVVVTGISGFDYATIKYAPDGDTVWVRRYNGPVNGLDEAHALTVDEGGNVYVTGHSTGNLTSFDYATVKYAPNGDTLWVRRFNGSGNNHDYGTAVAVDTGGNVYVTGYSWNDTSLFDYATIKYSPDGDTLWVRYYKGSGNEYDQPEALVVDHSGYVYLTGWSKGSGTSTDYATVKYAPDGDTVWVRRYSGPIFGLDEAYALDIDEAGNVYVTGSSWNGTNEDFVTIKYAPDGDTLWIRRYNGQANEDDGAYDLSLDTSGNVYVAGYSWNGANYDYATIGYAPNGDTLWVRHYNGPGDGSDVGYALKADASGNVYVTGYSNGAGTGDDYATIKYVQFTCIAKAGDVTGDGAVLLPDIVAIINFLFRSGPAPTPLCRGDANGNGTVLLPDIVYLINFIFKSGPAPVKTGQCCL